MLKSEWEKTNEFVSIENEIILDMITQSLPNLPFKSYKVISGGCVNYNIKLSFEEDNPDLILRIYLRENNVALKESALLKVLSGIIPVSNTLYVGKLDNYSFSIMKCLPGICLNDALINNSNDNFKDTLFEIGKILSRMQGFHFNKSGNLNEELEVIPYSGDHDYISYAMNCLENDHAQSVMDKGKISAVMQYIEKNRAHLPVSERPTLVHGDFDPANILVNKEKGKWIVTGIIDWEFAHSGSFLQDIANMLRYSHKLPHYYEKAFLQGFIATENILPNNWRESINLLNLVALLDCLVRDNPTSRPKRLKDILELIDHIIEKAS